MILNTKNQIERNGEIIKYTLRTSARARRMRLMVHHDGRVVMTIPYNMSKRLAERFIVKHVQWMVDRTRYFKTLPTGMLSKGSRQDFLKYREQARIRVQERLVHFNQTYHFTFNTVSIRNQRTRWGSCSRSGNLNFNYRITLIPERLADYIIVHELCHLKELNHSENFWRLVALTFPDHLAARNELKKI